MSHLALKEIQFENILKKLIFNLFNNLPSLVGFSFHHYF